MGSFFGAIGVLCPFYFHALNDWDLTTKTTLFPPETLSIIAFYSKEWIIGAIAGATIGLASVIISERLRSKRSD